MVIVRFSNTITTIPTSPKAQTFLQQDRIEARNWFYDLMREKMQNGEKISPISCKCYECDCGETCSSCLLCENCSEYHSVLKIYGAHKSFFGQDHHQTIIIHQKVQKIRKKLISLSIISL